MSSLSYLNQNMCTSDLSPIKNLKNTYVLIEFTQKEVLNLSKNILIICDVRMTSLWRHIYAIVHILGQKLKNLYHRKKASYRISSYIVEKLTKFWNTMIFGIVISVPVREISVLNFAQIPEKIGKSRILRGGSKIVEIQLGHKNEHFGNVSLNICIF